MCVMYILKEKGKKREREREKEKALAWLYGIEMYCMPTTLALVNNGAQNELLN